MGNVNDKLAYIAGTKTAIRDAIIAKGVAVPTETTFREYATKVGLIETGGSGAGEGDYLVRFFDWEGTILKEQRVNSGQNATAPTLPTHANLTFQSWNNAFTNVTRDIDVGATYVTTDGKTYLYIEVNAITGLSPILYLNKATTDLLTVNWGDGNTSTSSATGNINFTSVYAVAGNYTVTIECAGGYGFGNGAAATAVFGNTIYKNVLKTANVGINVTSISDNAFNGCFTLISVSIPSSVTSINDSAFNTCLVLTFVSIPSSVTSIGSIAFNTCFTLTSVSIPSSVTSIGTNVFSNCYALISISIPSSVTSISDNTFNGCRVLTSVSIPSSVISISDNAFNGCYALTSVSIPSSVTSIGTNVFSTCYSLMEYVFNSTTPPTLAATSAFTGITPITKIYVPDASVTAYKTATNWVTYSDYIYPLSTRP